MPQHFQQSKLANIFRELRGSTTKSFSSEQVTSASMAKIRHRLRNLRLRKHTKGQSTTISNTHAHDDAAPEKDSQEDAQAESIIIIRSRHKRSYGGWSLRMPKRRDDPSSTRTATRSTLDDLTKPPLGIIAYRPIIEIPRPEPFELSSLEERLDHIWEAYNAVEGDSPRPSKDDAVKQHHLQILKNLLPPSFSSENNVAEQTTIAALPQKQGRRSYSSQATTVVDSYREHWFETKGQVDDLETQNTELRVQVRELQEKTQTIEESLELSRIAKAANDKRLKDLELEIKLLKEQESPRADVSEHDIQELPSNNEIVEGTNGADSHMCRTSKIRDWVSNLEGADNEVTTAEMTSSRTIDAHENEDEDEGSRNDDGKNSASPSDDNPSETESRSLLVSGLHEPDSAVIDPVDEAASRASDFYEPSAYSALKFDIAFLRAEREALVSLNAENGNLRRQILSKDEDMKRLTADHTVEIHYLNELLKLSNTEVESLSQHLKQYKKIIDNKAKNYSKLESSYGDCAKERNNLLDRLQQTENALQDEKVKFLNFEFDHRAARTHIAMLEGHNEILDPPTPEEEQEWGFLRANGQYVTAAGYPWRAPSPIALPPPWDAVNQRFVDDFWPGQRILPRSI